MCHSQLFDEIKSFVSIYFVCGSAFGVRFDGDAWMLVRGAVRQKHKHQVILEIDLADIIRFGMYRLVGQSPEEEEE